MLKRILIALAAIVAIFVIVVALQPADFRVERVTTVVAPQADVFTKVNDFHKWDAWSPWAKLDPDVKVTFEGPDSGRGTVMTWAGNDKVGEGKMTLTESQPNDLVRLRVDFVKPFEGTATQVFAFNPQGDQTAVTWSMQGHNNSFIQKAFCLVMNGKKMIGDDFEKGLAQLKTVAESGKASSAQLAYFKHSSALRHQLADGRFRIGRPRHLKYSWLRRRLMGARLQGARAASKFRAIGHEVGLLEGRCFTEVAASSPRCRHHGRRGICHRTDLESTISFARLAFGQSRSPDQRRRNPTSRRHRLRRGRRDHAAAVGEPRSWQMPASHGADHLGLACRREYGK